MDMISFPIELDYLSIHLFSDFLKRLINQTKTTDVNTDLRYFVTQTKCIFKSVTPG